MRLFTEREIRINTDPGRCMRPLFVVDSKPHPDDPLEERRLFQLRVSEDQIAQMSPDNTDWTWDRVIEEGLCEYIDVEEEETIMIAMEFKDLKQASEVVNSAEQYRYTHCEMHPAVILGVCASIIPFPDHNQSPRNCYQSAMGKQAMGVYASNFPKRMDTIAHVLWYPMKPLVKTESMEFMRSRDLPSGQNAIIAIASYTGYNQEDSLIMNLSSIDRGFMRSMYYKYVDDSCKRKAQMSKETWENPKLVEDEIVGTISAKNKYHDLDTDGFCPPGTKLFDDHVLFGKTTEDLRDTAMASSRRKKDLSRPVTQKYANWTVDQVMVSYHKEKDCKIVKIRLRQMRTPQIGDKFASRHGQKGTVGMTFGQEDMPFTCEGIVPDIIMNPHAVPSRMTIGQVSFLVLPTQLLDISIHLSTHSFISRWWSAFRARSDRLSAKKRTRHHSARPPLNEQLKNCTRGSISVKGEFHCVHSISRHCNRFVGTRSCTMDTRVGVCPSESFSDQHIISA